MSLAFLAKKSWHTSTIKNVEKVWLAEQKAEAENKKLAELQKQLQEERQLQELRQLQAASGHVSKEVDNSLDWMYSGPSTQQVEQQTNEEFLLGKIYQPKTSHATIADALQPGILAMQTSKPSWESKVLSKNDTFTRVHEDPLLLIKQQEKKTRESILSNPLKLAKLREQVEAQIDDKPRKDKKQEKHEKKERKKEKKSDRHREDSEDRERKRRRSRSRERAMHDKVGSTSTSERDHTHRYDSRGREEREHDDKHRKRERSDSRDRRRRAPSPERHGDSIRRREEGYGLVKGKGVVGDSSGKSDYLGPKQELIAQRMEDERAELQRKKMQSQRSRPLTDEEREQRLREMEEDARISEELRLRRLSQAHARVSAEKDQRAQASRSADFLHSMRSEVYSNTNISMEERLHQNRHYSQRGADLDSHGFMNK